MSRYTAPSDYDYYAGSEPQPIELTCHTCQGRVYVSRNEPYPGPVVVCDRCARQAQPIAVPTQGAA
jgi:hypothetical protein